MAEHMNKTSGAPIYNIQRCLCAIAEDEGRETALKADGIFGEQTKKEVELFQKQHSMSADGEIDNDTWDSIVREYDAVNNRGCSVRLTAKRMLLKEGAHSPVLYPIEGVMRAVSECFDNVDFVDSISDTYSKNTADTVKSLQKIMGLPCSGEMSPKCWNMISRLYENALINGLLESAEKKDVPEGESGVEYVSREEITRDILSETEYGSGRCADEEAESDAADKKAAPSEKKKSDGVLRWNFY